MAREQPAVSVVIPCFNQARYLREAIQSVERQTVPALEIIVVDDGSTDGTQEVAASFRAVRCLRQENRGLAAARNAGLHAASGDFITFLDADDRLLPKALELGARQLNDRPEAVFVFGGYRFLDGEESRPGPRREQHRDLHAEMLGRNVVAMHATVMYRRDALLRAGGFDESLRACEDYDVYLRVTRESPAACYGDVIAEYRRHDANMSNDPALILRSALAALRKQQPHIGRRGYREGARQWRRWFASRVAQRLRSGVAAGVALAAHDPLAVAAALPAAAGRRWRRWRDRRVAFGSLRRLSPVSASFGFDRGLPIDRHYIESFLERYAEDITGRVLEVGGDDYTRRFGAGVSRCDVLHVDDSNPRATLIGDLGDGRDLPSDAFDCIVLTQTLHLIFDLKRAVGTVHRLLKPGGVVLATMPGITPLSRDEWAASWYWSLTPLSATRLFADAFGADAVSIAAHGNVLAATSFLQGIATEELTAEELDHVDPRYPMLITVRARKAAAR